jgi:hypothetical protein
MMRNDQGGRVQTICCGVSALGDSAEHLDPTCCNIDGAVTQLGEPRSPDRAIRGDRTTRRSIGREAAAGSDGLLRESSLRLSRMRRKAEPDPSAGHQHNARSNNLRALLIGGRAADGVMPCQSRRPRSGSGRPGPNSNRASAANTKNIIHFIEFRLDHVLGLCYVTNQPCS